MLGQRVEERVGRRVVRLPRRTQSAGGRGEQHERGQVQPLSQLVQVDRTVHFGPEHCLELLGRQRLHHAVRQQTRRVHDRGQRVFAWDACQHRGQLIALGHVTGSDRDVRTELRQLSHQVRRPSGVRCAARGQHQTPHPVLGHQVPGQQPPQGARAASHQHRALSGEHRPAIGLGCASPGQSGSEQRAVHVQRQLALVGERQCWQRGVSRLVSQIEQHEPAGVLGLGGPDQTPDRRCRWINPGAVRGCHHGMSGYQNQACGCTALLSQPLPHQVERGQREMTCPGRKISHGLLRHQHRRQHQIGHGIAGGEKAGEVGVTPHDHPGSGCQPEVVLAEHGHGFDLVGWCRDRQPLQLEQRVLVRVARFRQLVRRHRPQHERPHRGHRRAGRVGELNRHRVGAGRGQLDPEAGRTHSSHVNSGPGERQQASTIR